MEAVLSIGAFAVIFVLRMCESDRIDDARVSFMTMTEEHIADWSGFFENISAKQTRMEKCETITRNIITSETDDVEPCVGIMLFTRSEPEGAKLTLEDRTQLRKGVYNSSKRLIIIVHGFFQNPTKNWMEETKNALLNYGDFNVVIVDWNALSMHFYYPRVVQYAMKVAEYLAKYIDFFVDAGTNPEDIHLIGHSLGAHLVGVASHKATKGIVGRITGLDAARPLFVGLEDELKLEKSDAQFVDCIHTSGGFVGMPFPFCHADYFVNGGRVQPGCPELIGLGSCGHLRAAKYFIETISDDIRYKAFKCATMSHIDPVTCWEEGGLMGYPANKSHQGIFYVQTGVRPPYHTASSRKELELADIDTLNPIAWVAGKADLQ